MKLYSVYRRDRTDGRADEIRAETRPAHREYMDRFKDRVRAGGPLLDENGKSCGGLLLIEAETEAEVREIVKNDPFETAGLSGLIEVLEFRWATKRPDDMPPL